jgi:hypothetical protein
MKQPNEQSVADRIASLEAEIAEKKIKLPPDIFKYVAEHISAVNRILEEGRMPTEKDMEFMEHVRAWLNMSEEDRQELPSMENLLSNPVYKESKKRNLSVQQWKDVLAIAEHLGKNIKWIDDFFIFTIFPGLICTKGDLILENYPHSRLPENLKVAGSFTLTNSPVEKLPNRFGVAGDFKMSHCSKIRNFPPGFCTKEIPVQHVDINYCDSFEELPEGFLAYSLNLDMLPIKKLPVDFKVQNFAFIQRCDLNEIPDNENGAKFVGDFIHLGDCPHLSKLPKAIECKQITIVNCPSLKKLPDSIHVSKFDMPDSDYVEDLPNDFVVEHEITLSPSLEKKFKDKLEIIRKNQFQ